MTCVEPASFAFAAASRAIRRRRLSVAMIEGFFEDVPLTGHFAAVIFSFYCYSYIPDSRRRIDILRKAARHLVQGGYIFLGYPTDIPRPRAFMLRLAQVVGTVCGSDWRLEPGDLVHREAHSYGYGHVFTPEEVAAEVAAAGLRVVYRNEFPGGPLMALTAQTSNSEVPVATSPAFGRCSVQSPA